MDRTSVGILGKEIDGFGEHPRSPFVSKFKMQSTSARRSCSVLELSARLRWNGVDILGQSFQNQKGRGTRRRAWWLTPAYSRCKAKSNLPRRMSADGTSGGLSIEIILKRMSITCLFQSATFLLGRSPARRHALSIHQHGSRTLTLPQSVSHPVDQRR
ncbi:hypothetical protein SCHPADRAFT_172913 [Schizopora paradoxa]|uniref:Uncharacterized protein n=1 Tax=Schizopora paradoxa TaxID=27342 RepID=A0A0H2S0A0_9AGAM|nr:hypothetical protein SCHPADRAFT_172913 [Schizopora paradoxa]